MNVGKNHNKTPHRGKWKGKKNVHRGTKQAKREDEIEKKIGEYGNVKSDVISVFGDLPLSENTLDGLKTASYIHPTDIQKESIGYSLQGHDILGAAKTGSGKTLAFLVPVLEALWRTRWTQYDGLGALIISPTRELAYQTFDVLKKIGVKHDFSAGLVIGGKLINEESEHINNTNIIICTPGRLLQHMDQTYNFNADSLQILVLDEADKILSLGFKETMDAIFENLPSERQTLLYSATQTKSVEKLAALSMKDPIFVSVHEKSRFSTPSGLQQSYMVCELHEKLNILWSFLKHHLKHKILVFFSSCKQTRFIYETFYRLHPGITILALHGAMNQSKRVAAYDSFSRKKHAVLFATDIASRGLDFMGVNWVVQMDCPEDARTYIHRVGRTARYGEDGEAILVLLPSEKDTMLQLVEQNRIPIAKIRVNPSKNWVIEGKLQSLLASDVQLKEFAQRAFVSYIRSVFLMKNKSIFDVSKLDLEKYATSLGLAIAPRVRFLKKGNQPRIPENTGDETEKRESESRDAAALSKFLKIVGRKELEKPSVDEDKGTDEENETSNAFSSNVDDDVDLFTIKETCYDSIEDDCGEHVEEPTPESAEKAKKPLSKAKLAKRLAKKQFQVNTRIKFDESGELPENLAVRRRIEEEEEVDETIDEDTGLNIDAAKRRMQEEDTLDKEMYRQKVKQKHTEQKARDKLKRKLERAEKQPRLEHYDEDDEENATMITSGDEESVDNYSLLSNDVNPPVESFESNEKYSRLRNGKICHDDNDDDDEDDEDEDGDDDDDDDDEDEDEDVNSTGNDVDNSHRQIAKRRKVSDESSSISGRRKTEVRPDTENSLETDEAIAAKLLGLI